MQYCVVFHAVLVPLLIPPPVSLPQTLVLQLMPPSLSRGAGSHFHGLAFIYFLIFLLVVTLWVGQDSSLTVSSHRDGCAQVLADENLCILDVVKEVSKNNPLEIKIISVNRRQRVAFPVF